MDADIPLAYYFWNEESEKEVVKDTITKLAKEFRGKINFVGLEAKKFGMHAKNLNMKEEFPLFVIHDIDANLKYGLPQDKPLNTKDIPSFVKKFSKGKLEPIVKSEPIPTSQNDSVYHLVGYEHDKITALPKDVLVEYYAPWCGHCKKLAPVYEELASVYAADPEANDKVLISKIDHTENDVAKVDIKGYPTLILYPADGSDPVEFSGSRSLEGIAEFIKEKGSTGTDGLALLEKEKAKESDAAEEEVEVEKKEEKKEETKEEVKEEAKEEKKDEDKKVDAHDEL
ncbi:unnamed protein product [Ambrosiozyma monospora]|uniref:Unnamed protein product n=1 Tax=Ambrosiozyma monospora TaxID=43982 RepID=A0ACB5T9Z1_AMBMO|nr:unnamed protein product [Ambrosiozyma monospora]